VVYTSGMLIDFSGTAGMVRQTFQTEIHWLDVKGERHMSNLSDPRIPAALVPAVVGIASLNDFKPHGMYRQKADYTFSSDGFTEYAIVPGDLETIYNLNPLFSGGTTGAGQTVVVVEDTDMKPADWGTFRSTFGLSGYTSGTLTIAHPDCSDPGINGDSFEATIDAEWASAAAPNAAIKMISCPSTYPTFGGLIAIQNLLNSKVAPPAIMSMSYGLCEEVTPPAQRAEFNSAFQQAVSEGVSVFVSAGDANAAGCDRGSEEAIAGITITGWGETPYNVSVGGTDFSDLYTALEGGAPQSTYWNSTNSPTYESALSYVPEIPWNNSCASVLVATVEGYSTTYGSDGFCNSSAGASFLDIIGGSGGPSTCATGSVAGKDCQGYAKPSWQNVLGNPNDGVRDIPDVSLFASNNFWSHYYVSCYSLEGASCAGAPSTWAGAGGTSFSSPILAGIQALVNEKNGSYQGNPNVVYYALASAEYGDSGNSACNSSLGNGVASTCVFYDVTLGDMDVPCEGFRDCYTPSGTIGVLSTSNFSYEPAYGTTTGWDFATGIGTVNAQNLVNQWSSVAPKAASEK
jgi:subtilase family serine protease